MLYNLYFINSSWIYDNFNEDIFVYILQSNKKNFLLNWLFQMLIGYFDLILKIEIDRKNILNLKMCVNFFILDIYSYFVE